MDPGSDRSRVACEDSPANWRSASTLDNLVSLVPEVFGESPVIVERPISPSGVVGPFNLHPIHQREPCGIIRYEDLITADEIINLHGALPMFLQVFGSGQPLKIDGGGDYSLWGTMFKTIPN